MSYAMPRGSRQQPAPVSQVPLRISRCKHKKQKTKQHFRGQAGSSIPRPRPLCPSTPEPLVPRKLKSSSLWGGMTVRLAPGSLSSTACTESGVSRAMEGSKMSCSRAQEGVC